MATPARVRLGTGELTLSRVVFGCMEFAPAEASERIRTMHAAFDAGVTSFDTAPLYGFGAAEALLGRAIGQGQLAGRIEVLTKVGLCWDGDHGEPLFPFTDEMGVRRWVRRDARGASIREEVVRSLRRLRLETLDLVQVHQPDRRTPFSETFGVLADLRREGKVRAIGVSNFSAAQVRQAAAALGSAPLTAVQLEYNLVDRRAETELLPLARTRGLAVLTYSSLAQGLLAGRQRGQGALPADWRQTSPYFNPALITAVGTALEQVVVPMAQQRATTPAAICLAWLLSRPGVSAVIAGARTPEQAAANAAAATLSLSATEQDLISHAFRDIEIGRAAPLLHAAARRARSLLRRFISH
jgi:aryl-alcohol dehydrogenase-like predicted oxidoreductase